MYETLHLHSKSKIQIRKAIVKQCQVTKEGSYRTATAIVLESVPAALGWMTTEKVSGMFLVKNYHGRQPDSFRREGAGW